MKSLKNIKKLSLFVFVMLFLGTQTASCQTREATDKAQDIPVLEEAFETERDVAENVDSPTIWHGSNGQHWVIVTAKEGDALLVYNAADGSMIKRIEKTGKAAFDRPNGIAAIDNLVFVVGRNKARVQVLRLPDFKSLGFFGTKGDDPLIYPYGIAVVPKGDHTYNVFVTDNYNPYLQGYPAEAELEERVHKFRVKVSDDSLQSKRLDIFGEIYTKGTLHTVESIFADPTYNRLLIADEAYKQHNVKVYDLEGNFTGKVIPHKYFDGQPEGITLYKCDDGSGYWILTDQLETDKNKYLVFDRETLEYIGAFKGKVTRNTDGVWLTQKSFGPFEHGAFYAVNDDMSVSAISWTDIANALGLKKSCTK